MSVEALLKKGAEVVGGTLYYKRQDMGRYVGGQFVPTPEGAKMMSAAEPEVAAPAPAAKPAAKTAKAAKAAPAPAPAPEVTASKTPDSLMDELDNLEL